MADIPKSVIDVLIAEAVGEGPEGMRRVAETILNRAAVRGLSPEQVVTQKHQYAGYSKPGPAARRAQDDPATRADAEAAFRLALEPGDPTGGADHYFAPGSISEPSWAKSMTPKLPRARWRRWRCYLAEISAFFGDCQMVIRSFGKPPRHKKENGALIVRAKKMPQSNGSFAELP